MFCKNLDKIKIAIHKYKIFVNGLQAKFVLNKINYFYLHWFIHTDSIAMRLWSTFRLLTLVCLLVSSIWLVENQRFIREPTRRTKKVAWSSTFLRTIFSAKADFLLTIQLVMRMLKGGKLYQSGEVSMLETDLKTVPMNESICQSINQTNVLGIIMYNNMFYINYYTVLYPWVLLKT